MSSIKLTILSLFCLWASSAYSFGGDDLGRCTAILEIASFEMIKIGDAKTAKSFEVASKNLYKMATTRLGSREQADIYVDMEKKYRLIQLKQLDKNEFNSILRQQIEHCFVVYEKEANKR